MNPAQESWAPGTEDPGAEYILIDVEGHEAAGAHDYRWLYIYDYIYDNTYTTIYTYDCV